MFSSNGGIQAGQPYGTGAPLSTSQTGEKTWPDLVLEFLFPDLEVGSDFFFRLLPIEVNSRQRSFYLATDAVGRRCHTMPAFEGAGKIGLLGKA